MIKLNNINKALVEQLIMKIHTSYDYPADWQLTINELNCVVEALKRNAYQGQLNGVSMEELEDLIDISLRIDSNTGVIFFEGHQIDIQGKSTKYFKHIEDALAYFNKLTGEHVVNFENKLFYEHIDSMVYKNPSHQGDTIAYRYTSVI